MAAPQDAPELGFRLRKFQGTNTEIDSTFLGPSLVSRSENWVPTQSYRLGKRPGHTLMQNLGFGVVDITDLLAARPSTGGLYLYAYGRRPPAAGDAIIALSVEEGVWGFALPFGAGSPFQDESAIGRMIQFRDRIYCGNGSDPISSWIIGATDTTGNQTYSAIAPVVPPFHSPSNAPPVATPTAPVAAGVTPLPDGTYAYTWALYNPTSKFYEKRYDAGSVVIPAQCAAQFPVPAAVAGLVWRLFVAYRGFPIEYATMQADGPTATPVTLTTVDVTDVRCPTVGITRTGNMFVVWRNRLVFAGDKADPHCVCATDVLLPGTEQDTFNQGTFFPVGAKVLLPAVVTGVGIAGVTTDQDAQAPLLFFTLTKTFLCTGDPFDPNDQAVLQEVSSRVGCIGHDSIVNTPYGTIFVGIDSVYLIPPGGGYPQDIGWPIANQIRAIPPAARARIVACFHKQFYKLAIPASIATTQNTVQWWLDLRQGISDTPSWWGPHTIRDTPDTNSRPVALSAFTTDLGGAQEIDRGYAAYAESGHVVRMHQDGTYTDYIAGQAPTQIITTIRSVLQSGRFDADQPFTAKVFTRLRLIAQTAIHSFLGVAIKTDGGVDWSPIDAIELGLGADMPGQFVHSTVYPPIPTPVPPGPPIWKSWSTDTTYIPPSRIPTATRAQFRTISPVEVQTITPAIRPRGLSAVVTLTHDPTMRVDPNIDTRGGVGQVELRDFELLFIPSERKVRYVGESTGR